MCACGGLDAGGYTWIGVGEERPGPGLPFSQREYWLFLKERGHFKCDAE